jgi:hypothetical protein
MRSKERLTHGEQVERLGFERGVGLDEAEHRGVARRDHPGALGLRRQAHGAGGERQLQAGALGAGVAGEDRAREVVGIAGQLGAGGANAADHPLARQLGADHTGRGHGHLLRLDAELLRDGGLHREGGLDAARAVADVGAAGVRHNCAQAAPLGLPRHDHGRPHTRVGGEARGRHRVRLVRGDHAHVEPLGLDPGGHPRCPESGREKVSVELGHVLRRVHPA